MKKIELPQEDVIYGNKFIDSRDVTTQHTLDAGDYVIIPCTFRPGIELPFFITVFSVGGVEPILTQCIDWVAERVQVCEKYSNAG